MYTMYIVHIWETLVQNRIWLGLEIQFYRQIMICPYRVWEHAPLEYCAPPLLTPYRPFSPPVHSWSLRLKKDSLIIRIYVVLNHILYCALCTLYYFLCILYVCVCLYTSKCGMYGTLHAHTCAYAYVWVCVYTGDVYVVHLLLFIYVYVVMLGWVRLWLCTCGYVFFVSMRVYVCMRVRMCFNAHEYILFAHEYIVVCVCIYIYMI